MKNNLVNLTQEEWLNIKSKALGGSEISAILGVNPYKTAIDVYLEKVEGVKTENNIIMRAGIVLEPFVADLFQEETGNLVSFPEQKIYMHKDYDFLVGSPDRFYQNGKSKGVLECKTSSVNYDNIPEFWFLQDLWYMGIIGMEFGSVGWLKNNREFQYVEYSFIKELYDSMIYEAVEFWNKYILQHTPPPITEENKSETIKLYRSHIAGKKCLVEPHSAGLLLSLAKLKEIKKIIEDKENDLTDTVKMIMEDSEAIIDENENILVSWKKDKDGEKFDLDNFKKENPDLYKKYLIKKEGVRRFLFKQKNILPSGILFDESNFKKLIGEK